MFKRSKNITFDENRRTAKRLYFISDFWNLAYIAIFAKNSFNRFDPRLALISIVAETPYLQRVSAIFYAILIW